jgi:peptidyl-tRNA hydrolase
MSQQTKQVLVINRGTTRPTRAGKACAQAGHGAAAWLIARMRYAPGIFIAAERAWLEDGSTKIVVYVRSEAVLLAVLERAENAGLEAHLITDAGHTEFGGTRPRRASLLARVGPSRWTP